MIADLIENKILLNMKAEDNQSAIEELTDLIDDKVSSINNKVLVDDLMEREKLGSTGIGKGIALPHVRTEAVEGVVVAFGRSEKGVDFNALDDKPVHLFFLIASPENSENEYLNTLARVSRLLKKDQFREELLEAESNEAIIALFREKEE